MHSAVKASPTKVRCIVENSGAYFLFCHPVPAENACQKEQDAWSRWDLPKGAMQRNLGEGTLSAARRICYRLLGIDAQRMILLSNTGIGKKILGAEPDSQFVLVQEYAGKVKRDTLLDGMDGRSGTSRNLACEWIQGPELGWYAIRDDVRAMIKLSQEGVFAG